jgi:hypothetical protein
MRWSDD